MQRRLFCLALSLMLGITGALPLQAQEEPDYVASYTLTINPGWNAIANPLEVGQNRLSQIFPDFPEGSALAKYDAALGDYVKTRFSGGRWQVDDGFAGTLRPGEGAFLFLPPGQPVKQVIVTGLTRDFVPLTNALPGNNLVGGQSLGPLSFEGVMGFAPQVGDAVFFYDGAIGPRNPLPPGTGEATRVSRYGINGWDVVPVIESRQGVYVELANRPRALAMPPRLRLRLGTNGQFTAVGLFGRPTAYQWSREGTPLPNATNSTLPFASAQPSAAGLYRVDMTFGTVSVTSLNSRLTVQLPPIITNQPASLTLVEGATAVFRVGATGAPPILYQWYFNGTALPSPIGAQEALVLPKVQTANAGDYYAILSNPFGNATSAVATLTVIRPPRILVQPAGQLVSLGGSHVLTVAADGTAPLSYQWMLNGNNLPGATGPSLTLANFQPGQAGTYRVAVSNPGGAALSDPAEVRLNLPYSDLADHIPDAITLVQPTGLIRGTNTTASLDAGEPRHGGRTGGRSVWVNYQSAQGGVATFNTRGSSFDTVLAVYVGSDAGNLLEVASDDDRGQYLTSELTFNVQPNVPYRIVVDGIDGDAGDVLIGWDFTPSQDPFPNILEQPAGLTVAEGESAVFFVRASGINLRYQWYFNGQPIPNAILDTLTIADVRAENIGSYLVAVANNSYTNYSRVVDLDLREADGPGQPQFRAYDKFQDLVAALSGAPPVLGPATQVLGYTGSQTFSTAGSAGQNGEPIHCGVVGGHSKWYAYIPPTNGTLYLNTDGSSFDTILAVYTGCCTFSTLTPVACDNNGGTNGLASSLSFQAAANALYFIAVDGVAGVTGTAKLNYRLLVPMTLTSLARTNDSISFAFPVTPSWPYVVQRSTNLINWVPLYTGTSAVSPVVFTDTNPPAGLRLYRSVQSP